MISHIIQGPFLQILSLLSDKTEVVGETTSVVRQIMGEGEAKSYFPLTGVCSCSYKATSYDDTFFGGGNRSPQDPSSSPMGGTE